MLLADEVGTAFCQCNLFTHGITLSRIHDVKACLKSQVQKLH